MAVGVNAVSRCEQHRLASHEAACQQQPDNIGVPHAVCSRYTQSGDAFQCSLCSKTFEPGKPWNLCPCGGPLLVRYDLARMREVWSRDSFASAPDSMWRYAPALPVQSAQSVVSLGEGMTPLIACNRTGKRIGASHLLVKDEGMNPTASFKARGLSCAISMCVELGIQRLAIPSAGNAASALAAYAAAAGIEAHIFMPRDVPQANFLECKAYGANVTLVDGLISDCGRIVAERNAAEGWFDVSARSKSPTASRARRPWATKWPSRWAGNCPTRSSIPPAAASA